MQIVITFLAAAIGAAMPLPVLAQGTGEHAVHHDAKSGPSSPAATSDGEVRKVDKETGKLTLRHGPIPNLGMPNMTMVFRVKDPTMLDRVKAGDKVKFAAESIGGELTVTRLERAP
jgi:Cu/Ag efflux protein CusF